MTAAVRPPRRCSDSIQCPVVLIEYRDYRPPFAILVSNKISSSSSRKYDHVTPLLRTLHWLRVPERITFKLASLVFRCLNGTCSVAYRTDIINRAADVGTRRSLRSSSSSAVVVPVTRRGTIGDRAFPVTAARAWNVEQFTVVSTRLSHQLCYLGHVKNLVEDDGNHRRQCRLSNNI